MSNNTLAPSLTGWFLWPKRGVSCAVRTDSSVLVRFVLVFEGLILFHESNVTLLPRDLAAAPAWLYCRVTLLPCQRDLTAAPAWPYRRANVTLLPCQRDLTAAPAWSYCRANVTLPPPGIPYPVWGMAVDRIQYAQQHKDIWTCVLVLKLRKSNPSKSLNVCPKNCTASTESLPWLWSHVLPTIERASRCIKKGSFSRRKNWSSALSTFCSERVTGVLM